MKEDWKTLGVNTVRRWCNKVKDRGWLASKLGGIKKKRKEKKTEKEYKHSMLGLLHYVDYYATLLLCDKNRGPMRAVGGGDASARKWIR